MSALSQRLSIEFRKIAEARHHDPFDVLGRHPEGTQEAVYAYLPEAEAVTIADGKLPMERVPESDFFVWRGKKDSIPEHYRLSWLDKDSGTERTEYDPYCFAPQIGDMDLHLFGEGKHWHAYRFLGAHPHRAGKAEGVLFAVWAPNAERVSVVGDFNRWDGRRHPMRVRGCGVWELFIPGVKPGALYKFEIRSRDSGMLFLKSDPYGQQFELRPSTASIVTADADYGWGDAAWMKARAELDWVHAPMSVYEAHLGSWRRDAEGEFLNYRELAHQMVDYVKDMGFTAIELLPVSEHPLDASWGYQTLGYYAPTSRFGSPDDFRYFVDHCHQNGIGVLLDWVPAHFPKDAHGLARFDGTALYEHEDPRKGEHRDWSTLIFNYGRNEVKNFLVSNALYWLEEFHIDGLRVDAVASMLYLDYSREAGDWIPNQYGGRENLEAIEFLRELNTVCHGQQPGALIVAEESTAWPQVTRPTYVGGLGFSLKWNMGWMNDTLEYFHKEAVHRAYHHDWLTFSMLYAFTENFVLPFSHDEVVHGKGSMLHKMPGDEWQRFANLRLLYTYMYCHPGKKLLFMGCEFGQGQEWNFDQPLDWWVLDFPYHQGMKALVRDLNHVYREQPALHQKEFDWDGFEWIDCHDAHQSVISFMRKGETETLVVVLNFTPVVREGYRIGVPDPGVYRELLNSDSTYYAGSNVGNSAVNSEEKSWMGQPHSILLTLPPLAGVILKAEPFPEKLVADDAEEETAPQVAVEIEPE